MVSIVLSGVGLVLSGRPAAADYRVRLSPTLTDITDVAIFNRSTSVFSPGLSPAIGSVRAGETLDLSWRYGGAGTDIEYGFLGAYGTDGVCVTVDNQIADALLGRSWESIFTSSQFSERAVRAALTSFQDSNPDNDAYQFINDLGVYLDGLQVNVNGETRGLFAPITRGSTILNFSSAYKNGSAGIVVVPAPSAAIAFAVGAITMRRRRRA
jgi:hypothetical protein